MHVVLRADGGATIGYGHLIRSAALAEELLDRGHRLTVATTTLRPVQTVFPTAIETVELPSRGDPGPFVEWLTESTAEVVYTDAYPVDTAYQRSVREQTPLAVLQDDARHAVCAELFVNGNLYAESLDYEFLEPTPETCLGTDYTLLREEIRSRAVEEPPWREPPERAIVTMGGSDTANLTPGVVRAFDGVDISLDVIVGPGFDDAQEREIRLAARAITADVTVSRDPDDLPDRMFEADIAVCTASSTTYELLALGTPFICCPIIENQQRIAATVRDRDLATVVPRTDIEASVAAAVAQYVTDPDCRRSRRAAGRELVDGRGVYRVAAAIERIAD